MFWKYFFQIWSSFLVNLFLKCLLWLWQMLLAPPNASQLAQRRFSEVDAAIERHNSRRQAKRSQSVMYRQNQQLPHGGGQQRRNRSKRSGSDVNTNDVEAVQHRRRESRPIILTQQQLWVEKWLYFDYQQLKRCKHVFFLTLRIIILIENLLYT